MPIHDYDARREARIERLRRSADKRRNEAQVRQDAAQRLANFIPLGQPILVGHHSEKRHRRDLGRIHTNFQKACDLRDEADQLERSADAAESERSISADDPCAVRKLQERLEQFKALRERWKAINRAARIKSEPRRLAALQALALTKSESFTLSLHPTGAGFKVTNAGANIRRIEGRIAQLERERKRELPPEVQFGEVRIVETTDRVQIYFPGKPSAAVRGELKRAGFRWAPSEGAWQRRPGYWARKEAERIAQLKDSG